MEHLLVQPLPDLPAVRDARAPLRALIASLAPGGAERIVLEWLGAEVARGREAELAVLHPRRTALAPPPGIGLRVRGPESPEQFLRALACEWSGASAPVSTHLITDEHLATLWAEGVRTVPVIHNARAGWRNEPAAWDPRHVPQAVACAEAVRREMLAAGCRVPVIVLRHRPRVGSAATDPRLRREIRAELRVGEGTFLVGAIGAIKAQKDHARALEVVARLARRRDAVLVVLGGILERAGLVELDRLLEAAVRLGMADRLRLPGFVADIEPWLGACDALLNVSRFEGLSIAVQEALAAGLPVVAADVGGQAEIAHPAFELLAADADDDVFADRLARHPVRSALEPQPLARAPRAWSMTLAARPCGAGAIDTLFVTANLNAGGAQRSLVNLALALAGRHSFAIAVCGESTQRAFADALARRAIDAFRVTRARDDFAVAESVLAHAAARGARTVCFWNVAPGVKLLITRFAGPGLRIVDVSPGRYACEELEGAGEFGAAFDWTPGDHYARLDALVVKHADPHAPPVRRIERIPNGVAARAASSSRPARPRYLVSGRIAPSKRIDTILAAFEAVRRDMAGAQLHVVGAAEPRHAAHASALLAQCGPGVTWRGPAFDLGYLDESWSAAVVLGVHQGCPNAVLEAMSASIPVIANASGGTGELVVDGDSGWLLAEDADAHALARAMREAWADPAEASARAASGRARARSRYGIEAMARRYLALLDEGSAPRHATIDAWNSASAHAAPILSPNVPSPAKVVS